MIQIKTLSYDGPDDLHISIRFDNNICSSTLEIWVQPDTFKDFAEQLADFPFRQSRSLRFQYGDDDEKCTYYLLITVELYDPSGKIVIRTLVDNKGDDTYNYRCEFPIITDVATVNELGRQLSKWTPVENETWVFPADM